jgi:arylsulfatase A-like enzyme
VGWTEAVGVSIAANSLTKTASYGWNAGAVSDTHLASGDGYVEFVASETTTSRMLGLSTGNSGTSYADIDFAIYLRAGGELRIYEGGAYVGTYGTYVTGDTLRIGVVGGLVQYSRNGTVFETSALTPTYPLLVDTALYYPGATLSAVVVSGFSAPLVPVGDPVGWTSLVGVVDSANSLTKTATYGWNAGAVSGTHLASGDGYVEFAASETTTSRMLGLSNGNTDTSWWDIDFAIYLRAGGELRVYEGGTYVGTYGTYVTGDVLRIGVVGGLVQYYRNGTVFETSAQTPTYPLLVDTALYYTGATLSTVVVSGFSTPLAPVGDPVAWTSLVDVADSANSLTKTGTYGWNAGAVSLAHLSAGDGYVEFSASETTTSRMLGLSNGNGGTSYADIDFAMYLRAGGELRVYEGGTYVGTYGSYGTGDILRVEVAGGLVQYSRNGTVFETSALTPTYPLLVDTALYYPGATLTDVVTSGFASPPVAVDDGAVTDEDSAIPIDVLGNDTDADGDTLSVSNVTQPTYGAVVNGGSDVTYTPTADYCGPDSFTYTAHDGSADSNTATVSVDVTCINDPPVAVDDGATVTQGQSVDVEVLANDTDVEGGLSITGVTDGANGTVTTDGATVTYTHDGSATTSDTFTYTASDGDLEDTATVTVTIEPAPSTGVLEFHLVTTGDAGMTVTLDNTYASPVVVCSANYTNNTIPVVTRVSAVTSTSFDVRLQNPSGSAVAAEMVSCLVVEAGVHSVDGVSFEAWTYLSTITDNSGSWVGEAQSYGQSYTSPVVLGQVMSENDAAWSVFWARGGASGDPPTASTLYAGKTIAEDSGTRADETIGVIVFEAGHGTVAGVEYEAAVGGNSVQGIDDGPPYTYTFSTAFLAAPPVAVVSQAGMNGPNGGWAQTHGSPLATTTELSLSIDEDQIGDTERAHIAEEVAYVAFGVQIDNEPPVAGDDGATLDEDSTAYVIDVLSNDTDPDPGDVLSVSAVTQPANGSVTNNGSDVSYTPNANYCNDGVTTDDFTYTVSDGSIGTDTATVSVTVNCVNDLPMAVDDAAFVADLGSVEINVLGNDSDPDGTGLAVDSVTQGTNGSVSTNGTTVTYLHTATGTTSDTFTYTAMAGDGDTASATVNITAGGSGGQPNFLIMIGDDMGIDTATDLYPGLIEELESIYGMGSGVRGTPASTPVMLTELANKGMVFSHAWAQPVCSPTRGALITGLYANKTGVTAPGSPLPDDPTFSFVELLQAEGWRTAIFGKWHLGTNTSGVLPQEVGFDIFRGHTGGGIEDFWAYSYHVQDETTTNPSQHRTESPPTKSLPGIAATTFAPVVKAADAIETITDWETTDPDTPWLVWVAFNQAHWPMHVPNEDTLDAPSAAEIAACGGTFGTSSRGSCSDAVLVRAMTNAMDTVMEPLLDTVATLDPNTYIIFIGDNGTESDSLANMYLTTAGRGKGSVYESGARVAMAVTGPGVAAGSQNDEFVHAADLFATVLDLAGLPVPTTNYNLSGVEVASDSTSLAPILLGSASTVRDPNEGYILTETSFSGSKSGARNGTYKVVCTGSASSCEFYNLVDDPLEENPLAEPASCSGYRSTWTTADPEWHYCRLTEVVAAESIL